VLQKASFADRVVTADAEPEHEAERDQYPERRRQRRPNGPSDRDRCDQPVHVLAADQVGEPPENERADERGEQHRGVEQREMPRAQVPVLGDQRRGNPDDEQVIGVGEEPHPRRQHRPQVDPAQRCLVQVGDQLPGPDLGHRISLLPRP
jgi:hypothetical protein